MSKQKYPQTSVSTGDSGTVRKGRAEYSSYTLHAKRKFKREEAEARQEAYAKLSIAEKMKHAGKKELAKLQRRASASKIVNSR